MSEPVMDLTDIPVKETDGSLESVQNESFHDMPNSITQSIASTPEEKHEESKSLSSSVVSAPPGEAVVSLNTNAALPEQTLTPNEAAAPSHSGSEKDTTNEGGVESQHLLLRLRNGVHTFEEVCAVCYNSDMYLHFRSSRFAFLYMILLLFFFAMRCAYAYSHSFVLHFCQDITSGEELHETELSPLGRRNHFNPLAPKVYNCYRISTQYYLRGGSPNGWRTLLWSGLEAAWDGHVRDTAPAI
jgi:hypothetical protein